VLGRHLGGAVDGAVGDDHDVETGIERAWRDSRVLRIGGGTDEVMREIISKTMGL